MIWNSPRSLSLLIIRRNIESNVSTFSNTHRKHLRQSHKLFVSVDTTGSGIILNIPSFSLQFHSEQLFCAFIGLSEGTASVIILMIEKWSQSSNDQMSIVGLKIGTGKLRKSFIVLNSVNC